MSAIDELRKAVIAGEDDAADPPGIIDQCELVEPS